MFMGQGQNQIINIMNSTIIINKKKHITDCHGSIKNLKYANISRNVK